MTARALVLMDGGQGTGRTPRLFAALLLAAGGPPGRPVVLVDPLSAWSACQVAGLGPDASVLRGPLARSAEVFDVLAVMVSALPGLVVGIDDAEHAYAGRRRWSSLSAGVAASGGVLFVMLPDLGLWRPEGPPSAGPLQPRRHRPVRSFPGGAAAASLASSSVALAAGLGPCRCRRP